jgi:deoxyribonuclease-2
MPTALNEKGKFVDWWFMYKVSAESQSSAGRKVDGGEYVYYDADLANKKAKLTLSSSNLHKKQGALFETLGQLYGSAAKSNKSLGWYFYNDENPLTGVVAGAAQGGHTKGVLAYDFKKNTAFWLVQSTPLFPNPKKLEIPATGFKMAQTFLCVSLKDVATARTLAKQMYSAQEPSVYAASAVPAELKQNPNDYLVLLMKNQRAEGKDPLAIDVPFQSKKGENFRCIAKNRFWGHDFYNDLVGPRLHENLDVETWEHGKTPDVRDSDKIHQIVAAKSVRLDPLGIPIDWSESFDHAKLALSAQTEKKHWVCVGDINFTISQEKRGGGTVAFLCDPLWRSLIQVLSTTPLTKGRTKKKAVANKTATAAG